MLLLPSLLIITLAGGGFILAAYIFFKKRRAQAIVCPLKADCETVIHSQFARFFGIPVELLGMLYYGLIVVSYGVLLAFPSLAAPVVVFVLLVMTTAAFLFSLYLTFIQAFSIKQWCSWCLTSAGICTALFLLVATGSTTGLFELLARNYALLVAIHLFGLALGLGGATITDLFFFRFLRDRRISQHEADVMHVLSQVIWLGLAILIMSGLGLYLPNQVALLMSSKFLLKVVVVSVILLNGAYLNLVISPRLITISFGGEHHHEGGELTRFRRLAFALGAISATSWYSAFILGLARSVPLSFVQLLGVYVALLIGAISVSQLIEHRLMQGAR